MRELLLVGIAGLATLTMMGGLHTGGTNETLHSPGAPGGRMGDPGRGLPPDGLPLPGVRAQLVPDMVSDLQLHSATGANTGAPSTLAGGFEFMHGLGYGDLDDGGTVVTDSPVVGPVPESRGAEVAGRILTGRPLWAHRSLIAAAEARHALPVGMLAAIAVLESGGGTYVCHGNPHNAYGYGSCPGPPFATPEEAAERVAATLAGYSKYAGAHERLGIYNAGATGYAAGNGHAYADQALGIMEAAQ